MYFKFSVNTHMIVLNLNAVLGGEGLKGAFGGNGFE
jgi:hypothetical protein